MRITKFFLFVLLTLSTYSNENNTEVEDLAPKNEIELVYEESINKSENRIELKLPLLDAPYNIESKNKFFLESPSMNQALDLTSSLYLYSIDRTNKFLNEKISTENPLRYSLLKTLGTACIYLMVQQLPFGDIWLHEEYHRAVMNKNGIDSYNNVYNLDLFSDTIAVSKVKDEDLIDLKKNNAKDLVRLHAAGYEGQNELVFSLEKEAFFKNRNFVLEGYTFYSLMNLLNNYSYLNHTTTNEADKEVDEMNSIETQISTRDFTGYDFTAWTYDLFRPDEAYENRGVHPTGVGINRYIKYSQLNPEEQKYLKKQGRLAVLSFLDMQLFGKKDIKTSSGGKLTLSLRHQLTTFGNSIDTNILYKKDDLNLVTTIMTYNNYNKSFFGLNCEVVDYPLNFMNKKILLGYKASLWEQPKDQNFKVSQGEFGGLIGLEGKCFATDNLAYNIGFEAKTDGWVASNVYTDKNISMNLGISYFLD